MQLIGRGDALETLDGLVQNGARFVTVLGPPGIGKTSLAKAYRRRAEVSSRLVELAHIDTAEKARFAIANAVGLTDGEPDVARIADHLEHTSVDLLILDNLEQLSPAVSTLIDQLLESAPAVRVVATSRRRVGVSHEHLLELPPLESGAGGTAAELFSRRARQLNPDWRVNDEAALDSVLEHTAGVPLAIELAAARLRLVELPDLARRLEKRRSDPAISSASSPLAASVSTSWQLLDEQARRALGALAYLPGEFPLSLAERVVEAVAADGLEIVQRLRDDSLISRTERGLTVLPFVREFAIANVHGLDLGAVDRAICAAAEEVAGRFLEAGRASDLGRLGEYVAPLESLFERAEGDAVARVAAPLAVYYMRRGQSSARRQFQRELERKLPITESAPTQLCLRMAGVCTRQDASEAGLAWLERIGDSGRDVRKSAMVAAERAALLNTARSHGDALDELDTALPVLREHGEQVYVLRAFVSKFVAHYYLGDLPAARKTALETLEYAETFSQPPDYFVAVVLNNLCFLNSILGNAAEAHEQGGRALKLFELAGDMRAATMVRGYLGLLAMNLGDLDEARTHFDVAAVAHRETGDLLQEAFNLANLAELAALKGERSRTAKLLRASEAVAARIDWPGIEVHNAGVRATLAMAAGDLAGASTAFAAGLEHDAAPSMPNEFAYFTMFRAVLLRLAGDDWKDARDVASARLENVTNPHFLAASRVLSLALDEPGDDDFAEKAKLASRTLRVGLVDQPSIRDSFLVRRAWKFLEEHLSAEASIEVGAWVADPHSTGICFCDGVDRFRLPGAEWVDLGRRSTQAAMLRALVEVSLRGEGLSTEQLFERVWPGERAQPDAASNRVYNALALLRRNGLDGVLVRDEKGYRLAPDLELHELEVGAAFAS